MILNFQNDVFPLRWNKTIINYFCENMYLVSQSIIMNKHFHESFIIV